MTRTKRFAAAAAAVAALSLLATPAQASVMVIGAGDARLCYEAARDGAVGVFSLQRCNEALNDPTLTRFERAATYVNRGVIHLKRRAADAAIADFDTALGLEPLLAEARVNRGAALLLLRRPQEALTDITAGIALSPADPHEAYFNRAIAYEELGDFASAYADYQQAAALAPEWNAPRVELARFTVESR